MATQTPMFPRFCRECPPPLPFRKILNLETPNSSWMTDPNSIDQWLGLCVTKWLLESKELLLRAPLNSKINSTKRDKIRMEVPNKGRPLYMDSWPTAAAKPKRTFSIQPTLQMQLLKTKLLITLRLFTRGNPLQETPISATLASKIGIEQLARSNAELTTM